MQKKEGGWGWCVTGASFVVHCIICGISYSSGVFHQFFLAHYGASQFTTAWISSLLMSFTALGAIPGYMMTYQFGYRVTVILGGLFAAAGLGISALAMEMYEIYLTVGALTGLGFGIALAPSIMIIESYFHSRRVVATNIAVSGVSIGIFSFPLIAYHLERSFAWKGMVLVLAGFCLNICLCGITMRETSLGKKKDLLKMFEFSLMKSSAFVALLLSNFLWSMAISIIYTHLPGYAIHTGLSMEDGVVLVAISGVSGFASRSMFLIFSHSAKLDNISTFLCTIGMAAILTGLFPELFQHKAGEIGYAIMLGLHCGYWSTFVTHIVKELIGQEYIAYGKGFVSLSVGIGLLIGSPLAGLIYDIEKKYDISFYVAGSCLLLSSSILMVVNLKRCHYRPAADWFDSDSESSGTGSNSRMSGNPEEDTLIVTSVMTTV